MQRDRSKERPRSHHRVRLRRLRRSRARLRSLLRLTGALDVPTSSPNIRHARTHHQGAFARRHLVGRQTQKGPSPRRCHPSEDPRKTKMDDETRRYCVFRIPFASKLFFGSYPESRRFLTYWSRSLLLTPPGQTTGDGPPPANAFGYIGRAYGFGFIAAVDAFGFTARL